MKKFKLLITSTFLITCTLYAQVKEYEINIKNSKGKAELINFSETKINSDNKSVNEFLKKQFNSKSETEFKVDSMFIYTENDLETKKYQQYYKGIKVEFAIQSVVSKNKVLKTVSSKYVDIRELEITPKLTEKEALSFALKEIGAKEYMWENIENERHLKQEQSNKNATYYPKGELVIVEKDIFETNPTPRLAYKFNVYAAIPISRNYIYIDAIDGKALLKDPIIKHVVGVGDTRYSGQRSFETQQLQ